jgi:hypothetical protein
MYANRNVIKKEAEKVAKYKDLRTELQRMWNVKTIVIQVITGATGTISKSFRKQLSVLKEGRPRTLFFMCLFLLSYFKHYMFRL